MAVVPLVDRSFGTGVTGINAPFPFGDGGGWDKPLTSRTGSSNAYALSYNGSGDTTKGYVTLNSDSFTITTPSPAVTFPINFAALFNGVTSTSYSRYRIEFYFKHSPAIHKMIQSCMFQDSTGSQLGIKLETTGSNGFIRVIRNYSNNSYAIFTASTNFVQPSTGTPMLLRTEAFVNPADLDLSFDSKLFNLTTDPTATGTPLKAVTFTAVGTFSWTNIPTGIGVAQGDNVSETITGPEITRIVISGISSTLSMLSGMDTYYINKTGKRTVVVSQSDFPSAPTFSVISGLPSGATVNTGESTLSPGNTTSPAAIVIDTNNVATGNYTITVQAVGTETSTITFTLSVIDTSAIPANETRIVLSGTSSADSAQSKVLEALNTVYTPNTVSMSDNAHAALSLTGDWNRVPSAGQNGMYHQLLNYAIQNRAEIISYGHYYADYGSASVASVLSAYDTMWREAVYNGINVTQMSHQEVANGTFLATGSVQAFTQDANYGYVTVQSGHGALSEAGDGIYVAKPDGTAQQFAEILEVTGNVLRTEKFLDETALPTSGLAYSIGDKTKHQYLQSVRAGLVNFGDPLHASYISDTFGNSGARYRFVGRNQLKSGKEPHDIWRAYVNNDNYHVASAGNTLYGQLGAEAKAYADIDRMTTSLSPNPLDAEVGDADTTFTRSDNLRGDTSLPAELVSGSWYTSGGVGTVNSSTGAFTPTDAGTGTVWYEFAYHATKDPSAVVNVTVSDITPPVIFDAIVSSDGLSVVVNLTETESTPILPSSGITGFSIKINGGVYQSISGTRTGSTQITLTAPTTIYNIDTVLLKYEQASGNVTDGIALPLDEFNDFAVEVDSAPNEIVAPVFASAAVSSNGLSVVVNVTEANSLPVLPATGVTGFSVKINGGAYQSVTGVRSGNTQVTLTAPTTIYNIDTVLLKYDQSTGNLTDNVGNELTAFTDANVDESAAPNEVVAPVFANATVSGDGLSVVVSITEATSVPLIPATGITGFAIKINGGAYQSVTGVRTGNTQVTLTAPTTIYNVDTVLLRYQQSTGNLTDAVGNELTGFTDANVDESSAPNEVVAPVVASAVVSSDGDSIVVGLTEANSVPLLPSTGITGFGISINGQSYQSVNAVRTGNTQVTLTAPTTIYNTDIVLLRYVQSSGNLTDNVGNETAEVSDFAVDESAAPNAPQTPPTLISAVVESTGDTILLTFSVQVPPLIPATGITGFSVKINDGEYVDVTGIRVASNKVQLTAPTRIYVTDIVLLKYTEG